MDFPLRGHLQNTSIFDGTKTMGFPLLPKTQRPNPLNNTKNAVANWKKSPFPRGRSSFFIYKWAILHSYVNQWASH